MSNEDGALYVDLREWGKALLEEILFRAARDISQQPATPISVSLEFRVAPDEPTRTIEISMTGAVEAVIRTRVPLDG